MSRSKRRIRSRILRVRLSDAEYDTAEAHALAAGYEVIAAFTRDLLAAATGERPAAPAGKSPHDAVRLELLRIGNNLNQLARRANIHGALERQDDDDLAELQKELYGALGRL